MSKKSVILLVCMMLVTSFMVVFPIDKVAAADAYAVFYPSDDTYIIESSPDTNMGSYIELQTRGQLHDNLNILIKFDLSTIASTYVKKATLKLYYFTYYVADPVGRLLYAHRLTSDWDEGNVTWNTHPSYVPYPNITDSATVPVSFGDISWDVTEDVKKFIDGTYNNSGWVIDDTFSNSDATTVFYSKEGTSNNNLKPRLEIEVINQPPETPIINGPTSGKPGQMYSYVFVSEDPDGDDVYYEILWGDGTFEEWFGPYSSDELVIVNHSWSSKGTYIIMARAKDVCNATSDWGTLEVTMPKNKAINTPFLNFLQSYPNLFRIMEKLLQRLGLQ